MANKTRNTNIAMLIVFIVLLVLGIIVISSTNCGGTVKTYQMVGDEQYYGIVEETNVTRYYTLVYIQLVNDHHPLIIKLDGYQDFIQPGDRVWIKETLPDNDFAIIEIAGRCYKYPMLK